MRLLQFEASGFRSLGNVNLDFEAAGATRVAVLRGKNGAGKSNVLRAIDLWVNLLWHGPRPGSPMDRRLPDLDLGLSIDDFCRQQPGPIRLSGSLTGLKILLEQSQLANPFSINSIMARFEIVRSPEGIQLRCEDYIVNDLPLSVREGLGQIPGLGSFRDAFSTAVLDGFRLHAIKHIPAFRRLQRERPDEKRPIRPIDLSVESFQEFLFDAPHSPDPVLRSAYKRFQNFISSPPLNRGTLTVVKDAAGLSLLEERKLGEVTVDLPVRSLGSGEQEVLVLMGLVFLSGAAIVSIEEPEAHLHWKSQQLLGEALRRLFKDDSVLPLQVILESHSHEFQYGDYFFDVSRDEDTGLTQVVSKPNEEAYIHFNEPGPVRDALQKLLNRLLKPDEVLYRTLTGSTVTAGQMLQWLEKNDPKAREFLEQTARSVLLAMANEQRARHGSK